VKAFSLNNTFGDLIKIPQSPVPGQLACVNGIRVGSILWVMLGHTYMINGSWPLVNYLSGSYKVHIFYQQINNTGDTIIKVLFSSFGNFSPRRS
jgi:hypothetical protein